jgi:hypothetical protein
MRAVYLLLALLAVALAAGCVTGNVPLSITGAAVAPEVQQDIVLNRVKLAEFSGVDTYVKTDAFTPTKGWRYVWSCKGDGKINVYIYRTGSKIFASTALGQECPGSGSKSVQEGGIEYYIRVRTEGAESWNVLVEE